MTEANEKTASAPTTARPSWFRRKVLTGNRLHKWLIVLLAGGCAGLYGWHLWRMNELSGQRDQDRLALKSQVEDAIQRQMEVSLRITGMGLSWAATQAMQGSNLDGINTHITRMVKEGPVKLVAVVDREGVVRVATNKKLEGQPASAEFPGVPLAATELTVIERGAELVLVAPLEYGLGSAVLVYDWPDLVGEPAAGIAGPAAPQTAPPAPTTPATPATTPTPAPAP